MEGENFVRLKGKIVYPDFKIVGVNNSKLFKAKVAIPAPSPDRGYQYIKISAWGDTAESLSDLPSDSFIEMYGHIEERSYDGKCKHCSGYDKKFWTEVQVDYFRLIGG